MIRLVSEEEEEETDDEVHDEDGAHQLRIPHHEPHHQFLPPPSPH